MEPSRPQPSYEELAELVAAQANRIAELEAEVAELRCRLGMNPTNSSKPPSSDQSGRPRPQRSGGEGSGRRRGKQPGTPGMARRLVDDPNQTLEHRPDRCGNPACGAGLGGAVEYARQRRQVVDLPPVKPYVIEHQLVALRCGCCGQVTDPAAPVGVSGRLQYGPGVKAAVVYGRGEQYLPYQRTARLMSDLLGISVSVGFAHQVVAEAAARLGPFVSHSNCSTLDLSFNSTTPFVIALADVTQRRTCRSRVGPSQTITRPPSGATSGCHTHPAAVRDILLPPFLVDLLREHLASHDHEHAFIGRDGGLLRRSSFHRRTWRPAVDGNPAKNISPILPGMHFHDLRHTHKTWLIEDEVPEAAQAKRLGHRLPGIRGVYSHVSAAVEQRLVNGFQRRWLKKLPTPARLRVTTLDN